MRIVEETWYKEDNIVAPPSPYHPRYGLEIEFRPKTEYCSRGWGADSYTIKTPKTSKSIGSRYFSQEILSEFYDRIGNKMNFGKDGHNVELRTNPGTKRSIFSCLELLLSEPLTTIYKNQPDDTGIHIHSDVRNYNPSHLYRNLSFICSKQKDIVSLMSLISRRTNEMGYGYIPGMNTLSYDSDGFTKRSQRNGVFLFSSHNTHEFRFFKTTSDKVTASMCVDFIDAVNVFSRKEEGFEIDVETFMKFVTKRSKSFPYLLQFLKKVS